MREIEFRGYSKLNNMWFYGLLGKFDDKYYIECKGGTKPFVDEASVGQYTGFTDKNGQKIYEGDILDAGFGIIQIVVFEAGQWLAKCKENKYFSHSVYSEQHSSHCEVIGNIYEERIKGGKDGRK